MQQKLAAIKEKWLPEHKRLRTQGRKEERNERQRPQSVAPSRIPTRTEVISTEDASYDDLSKACKRKKQAMKKRQYIPDEGCISSDEEPTPARKRGRIRVGAEDAADGTAGAPLSTSSSSTTLAHVVEKREGPLGKPESTASRVRLVEKREGPLDNRESTASRDRAVVKLEDPAEELESTAISTRRARLRAEKRDVPIPRMRQWGVPSVPRFKAAVTINH